MSKGSVFVYFDGSVKEGEGGGIGFVIKSLDGTILHREGRSIETENSMVAEATALKSAIEYVCEAYPSSPVVYIKGDNKGIIESVDPKSSKTVRGAARNIVNEVKRLLSRFQTVSASLVPDRDFNAMADELARKGRQQRV